MSDRYYLHSYTNTDGETVYVDGVWWKEMDGLFGRIRIMMPEGSTIPGSRSNCSCCGMSAVEATAALLELRRRR